MGSQLQSSKDFIAVTAIQAYVSLTFYVVFLQVRKILDLVQSKGEEVSEYFIYILQEVSDAYYELQPWLDEIGFHPSENIQNKPVVNTDPGRKKCKRQYAGQFSVENMSPEKDVLLLTRLTSFIH